MTQTINFTSFPFTHKGINFVSKVADTSRFLPQIIAIGDEFITMNKGAVDEILEITDETTHEELVEMLAYINEGGTEMFLELAGE
jgi:hypothetical protein